MAVPSSAAGAPGDSESARPVGGWLDTEPALGAATRATLATLARRARRIVWLNPLLGRPGFTPESRGMRAAMPHLDLLAPAGDLASIERALPRILEALR